MYSETDYKRLEDDDDTPIYLDYARFVKDEVKEPG